MAKKAPQPRSMTGFGAARCKDGDYEVNVEIRSVNSRFLQIKTRLPHDYTPLEQEVESLVRARLGRGSVSVRVGVVQSQGKDALLDFKAAGAYSRDLAQLAEQLGLPGDVDLSSLVTLPGVLVPPPGPKPAEILPLMQRVLALALDNLDKMRIAEGLAMVKDLDKRAERITGFLKKVERRLPVALRAAKKKLHERVAALLAPESHSLSDGDLAREMAILADKVDVSEELTRFASHQQQWQKITTKGGQIGKRLEFLLQEMGREVNTLGSKSNDLTISHLVVELKAELEKQREQIQNLE